MPYQIPPDAMMGTPGQPPASSPLDLLKMLYSGSRKDDINLPAEPGAQMDPRLMGHRPGDLGQQLQKALQGLKTVQSLGQ